MDKRSKEETSLILHDVIYARALIDTVLYHARLPYSLKLVAYAPLVSRRIRANPCGSLQRARLIQVHILLVGCFHGSC